MTNHATQQELRQVAAKKKAEATKGPSKKTQLIKLLSRKSGADAKAISAKFGWQPHTTRAALSGLRKVNRPQFAGGSKVSMDGAYGKK
jgi:hypothetical protein